MYYTSFLPDYSVGEDCYDAVPKIAKQYGKTAVVIGGKTAMSKAKPYLDEAVKSSEIEIIDYIWYGGDSSYENAQMLIDNPVVQKADMIFAVGGGVKNDLWMQIVADVTGKEISTPAITVGASFGDALMAASGIKYSGFESFNKLTDFIKPGKTYHPNKENHEAYKKYQNIYDSLYPATVNLMHCLSD